MNDLSRNEVAMSTEHSRRTGAAIAQDFSSEIQRACLEVSIALAAQDELQKGALCVPDNIVGLRVGLIQGRARVNSALSQLRCISAKTPTELGLKIRCFQQIKENLGEDDSRVAELALSLLDEAAILLPALSLNNIPDYSDISASTTSRGGRRLAVPSRSDFGALLGWKRRSHGGE